MVIASHPEDSDTRCRILDAAAALVATEGFDAVTMRAVAKIVGVTPMALYRHFDDKEALLGAALEQGFGLFRQHLAHGDQVGDEGAALRVTVEAFRDFAWDHGAYFELMFLTARLPDGIRQRDAIVAQSTPAYRLLLRRVRACLGDMSSEADVESHARRLLAAAVGAVALHRAGVFPPDRAAATRGFDDVMAPLLDELALRDNPSTSSTA